MSSRLAQLDGSLLPAPRVRRTLGKEELRLVVTVGLLAVAALGLLRLAVPAAQSARPSAGSKQQALSAYQKLPLAFVPNAGQTDARVRYSAQRAGMSVFFTRSEAVLAFAKGKQAEALALRFLGAKPTAIQGRQPSLEKVSYMLGRNPTKWRTGLPTYGRLVYRDLWPGIDMSFRGGGSRLEYEFLVRPGAEVSNLRLAYRGANGLWLDKDGNLRIRTRFGLLTDARPRSYQLIGGRRVPVESRFVLQPGRAFGFAVGRHDPNRPLVIDPGLVYSTYLGGSGDDNGFGIALDATGNAYVTGFTASSNFPTTLGAYKTSYSGGASDVFVTKLNAAGSGLVYSTFLGGSSGEQGLGIAVDASGNAYVTGFTGSTNFPVKADTSQIPPGSFIYRGTYQGGSTDAFVTKLNPTGTGLVFSTFAGGSGADEGWGIAVHSSGDVYVTGDTSSTNWATTTNALQHSNAGGTDAFFLRLDRFAAAAGYMTYIGGSGTDSARAIAIDASRNVYLTGGTTSSNFPTTTGAFDTSANGGEDSFATKLTYGGSTMTTGDTYVRGYSSYLGGSGTDRGLGIAIDGAGDAYLTGITSSSTNFPVTAGAFSMSYGGGAFDAFVTKFNPTGGAPLVYSTYLGGSGDDRGQGIALDSANDAHVVGRTSSSNFPTTPGAYDTSYNGGDDAFVTKLNPAGSSPLLYSTFLGGSSGPSGNNDRGMAIALGPTGNAYVTGLTNSSNFPTTPGAYDTSYNGGADAFVTRLDMIGAPYTLTLSPVTAMNTVGTPHTVTATVRDFGGRPVPGVTVRFTVSGANSTTGSCVTATNGQCSFTYTGMHAGTDTITAYADTNTNGMRDAGEPSGMATKIWEAGAPFRMTLERATATNQVGETHCVTATVYDVFDNPVPGITVRFSVPTHVATFATPDSGSDTTDANGEAMFCFTASLPGTDTIHAYADTNNDQMEGPPPPGGDEPFADATKIWTPPASTAFCEVTITNGGWIIADNTDRANFGGNAKVSADGTSVQGQEQYQDQGPMAPLNMHSISLLATTCSNDLTSASIYGTATIDGSGTHMFRIDVTDMGTSGANDSYGIILDTGYASGQKQLQGGNVTIHKS
jgi:Bacterial Ig-like domain (group 1)/Beta-propeller repeat